jgi:hypothetical protein
MPTHIDIRKKRLQECFGKEVFEVQPVVLGGSPTDPGNKTLLERKHHIQAVRYWNQIIRDLRQNSVER